MVEVVQTLKLALLFQLDKINNELNGINAQNER